MRRAWVVVAAAAALTGCSGDGGAPDEPVTRARLLASGEGLSSGCPPLTTHRIGQQGIAFSGTVRLERPNPENPDRVQWAVVVDHWFSRDRADVVVVQATSDVALGYFSDAVADGSARIEDGDRLLVAGPDRPHRGPAGDGTELVGTADSCLTRRWSDELAAEYERAFPR